MKITEVGTNTSQKKKKKKFDTHLIKIMKNRDYLTVYDALINFHKFHLFKKENWRKF